MEGVVDRAAAEQILVCEARSRGYCDYSAPASLALDPLLSAKLEKQQLFLH